LDSTGREASDQLTAVGFVVKFDAGRETVLIESG
jgi:hypothetical protein